MAERWNKSLHFSRCRLSLSFFSNCLLLKKEALEELEFYIRIIIKEQ